MKKIFSILYILTFIINLSTCLSFAQKIEYKTLAPIESQGIGKTIEIDKTTFSDYVNSLYKIGVSIAVGLAVLMVIWGGIEYITSDALGGKEGGKEKITQAIAGLLLALGSYIILRTIDSNLTNTQLDIEYATTPAPQPIQSFIPEDGGHGQSGPAEGGVVNRTLAEAWGMEGYSNYEGQEIPDARQTYYASGEANSDSDTDAGRGSFGQSLVLGEFGGATGSAASVFYPAGTLLSINGTNYIVDDNNLTKRNGGYQPVNQNLTNYKTVDIYTNNLNYANNGGPSSSMKILYTPKEKITDYKTIKDIRENPNNYIGH